MSDAGFISLFFLDVHARVPMQPGVRHISAAAASAVTASGGGGDDVWRYFSQTTMRAIMRLRMRMMAAMPTAMMVGLVVRRNGGSFGCRRLPPPPGEESVAADIASTEIRSRLESRTVAGPPLKSMAAGLCGLDGISRLLCSAELAVSHFCCRRSVFPQQHTVH